jgi:FkbH-like protein
MPSTSRETIDHLIHQGTALQARAALTMLWSESPALPTAGFVVSRFEQLRPHLRFTSCRVAILRSFTVEPVVPLLRAAAFCGGIDLDVRLGSFNAWQQDILDPAGWLYPFSPDVVIIAVQTCDISPPLWNGFADLGAADVQAAIEEAAGAFAKSVETLRSRSNAHLVIHSLEHPAIRAHGLLDNRLTPSQSSAIETINTSLADMARAASNVYMLDYNAPIARRGHAAWHDERKWLTARMPIAAGELIHLAREWMRFLHPITGRISKVLAVDLDNTLWGGVIGEDEMDGIQLDDNYPGAAYRALQRAILDLHRRGVLLAVCSKNDAAEAMAIMETHPGMLLRREHFSALRINWADKAANLRDIAAELNVGIDSVAFLDDNPVERDWIRSQLPEVSVIDLPADPMQFAQALRDCPLFERLQLTEEDKSRGPFYAGQKLRAGLQQSASSLEDFYRSLEMRVKIEPIDARTLARAAQLAQKTNQFNLTTRRYSEQQLAGLLAQPQWQGFTLQLIDRFGDNGIVGAALLRHEEGRCEIDTFLLSCRVIGRTVETALLASLATQAAARGARQLAGWFIPTKKNAPAADFYERHGFHRAEEREGETLWELELGNTAIVVPKWISY